MGFGDVAGTVGSDGVKLIVGLGDKDQSAGKDGRRGDVAAEAFSFQSSAPVTGS